jgi:predicted outer membrane repeat protein
VKAAFILPLFFSFLFCAESFAQRTDFNGVTTNYNAPTLFNGYVNGRGGAIRLLNGAVVNIIRIGDLTFTYNTATGGYGGAISVESGSTLNIDLPNNTVTFQYNSAWGGARGHGGGAIWVEGTNSKIIINSNKLIIDSNFKRNNGGDNNVSGGGGIKAVDNGVIDIKSSIVIFSNNSSNQDGPGGMLASGGKIQFESSVSSMEFSNGFGVYNSVIYIYDNNTQLIFNNQNSYFIKNTATNASNWGALAIVGGSGHSITFDPGSIWGVIYFEKNFAGYGSVITIKDGSGNSLSVRNSTLTAIANTAQSKGGVISAGSNNTVVFTNVVSSYTGNIAPIGAIISAAGTSRLTFSGGQIIFTANTSINANSQGTINLEDSSILELTNISVMRGARNAAGSGGFLYVPNNTFNFAGVLLQMTSNTAFGDASGGYGRGGSFYFTGSDVNFAGSTIVFNYNVAQGSGGAMYISGKKTAAGGAKYSAASMTFTGNRAMSGDGGAIYFEAGGIANFDIGSSISFTSNIVSGFGGAIYLDQASATFGGAATKEMRFLGNSAQMGGSIYLGAMVGTASFRASSMTFYKNSASVGGGGLYFSSAAANFGGVGAYSMTFTSNATSGLGAGMYFYNSSATFAFSMVMNFQYNTALSSGGAMYFKDSKAAYFKAVRRLEFIGNRSGGRGGGMYFEGTPVVEFRPEVLTFMNNSASLSGGGMSFSGSKVTFQDASFDSMTFSSNIAGRYGGAIYLDNSEVMFGATYLMRFQGNTANFAGGALYLSNISIGNFDTSMGSLYFTSNVALNANVSSGGAIYLSASTMIFNAGRSMEFKYNTAHFGSVLYATYDSYVKFTQGAVIIEGNKTLNSKGNGVIAWDGGSNVEFSGLQSLTARLNEAQSGGFLYILRGSFILGASSIDISSNTARDNGGAIFLDGATIEFGSNYIPMTYNRAQNLGGAIYLRGSSVDFSAANIEFIGNKSNNGGAIYADSGSSIVFRDGNVRIEENESLAGPGVVGWVDSYVAFRNLTNLWAVKNRALYGGFLSIVGANFLLEAQNIEITSNAAFGAGASPQGNGGGIYLSNSTITFANVSLSWNSANRNGGAIYADNHSSLTFSAVYSDMILTGNIGERGGAVYIAGASDIKLYANGRDIIFSRNTALTGQGHDIYIESARITFDAVSGSSISIPSGIYGAGSGSEINQKGAGYLYISGENYFGPNISSFGAVGGGVMEIERATFQYISNSASMYAGAGSQIIFRYSTAVFSKNNSILNGGALYDEGTARIMIEHSSIVFSSNISAGNGGALYIGSNSTITFRDTRIGIIGNTAKSSAGFAFIDNIGTLEFIDMRRLEFTSNSAYFGGGVFYLADSKARLDMRDTVELIGRYNNAANGGFTYIKGQRFDFTNNSSVIMYGNSASTGSGGAFYLDGSTVIFSNIGVMQLDYNVARSSGGGIYISGGSLVRFSDFDVLSFTANTANLDGGGVIYVDRGSKLEFSRINSLKGFKNVGGSGGFAYFNAQNFAFNNMSIEMISNTARTGSGGVFYLDYSTMVFDRVDTALNYNYALTSGGAIYIGKGSSVTFRNIDTLHFHHNTTEFGGGGVFYVNETARLTFNGIRHLIGEYNAAGEGGFAYFGSQYFRFNNTDIVLTHNTSFNGSGGALYLTGTDIIFDDIYQLFEYNHSASSGGAFFAQRSTIVFDNIAVLDFRRNSAIDAGGVFYVDVHSLFETIGAREINALYNTAGEGGFIYFQKRAFHFSNMSVLMDSNRAESNPATNNGGAFTFYGSTISFINDTAVFRNNYAGSKGGVIYADNGTRVDFIGTDVDFIRNTAGFMGGGLNVDNGSTVSFASLGFNKRNKVSFIENSAVLGGILAVDNKSIVIFDGVDVEFRDNYSDEGGGMYINNGSSVVFTGMEGVKYSYNTATSSGGAIFIDEERANVTFSYMKDLLFSYNTAELSGGAVFVGNRNSSLIFAHIDKLSGIYNTADEGGFGFFANQDLVYFEDIPVFELLKNTAYKGNGGAIYLTTSPLKFLNRETEISGNFAAKLGGGIYSQNAVIDFLGEQAIYADLGFLKMERNTAQMGGAIYSRYSEINFNDRDIIFGYNVAESTGRNRGQGSGGALYLVNTTVNFSLQTGGQVKRLSFIGNTGDSFGAIYIQDSVIHFNDIDLLEFIDNETTNLNTSTSSYGGVFGAGLGRGESIIDISNVGLLLARNNKANRGGFLYLNEAVQDVNIMTIIASSNTATNGSGGAIYVTGVRREVNIGGDLTGQETLFIGNRASADGGAIYAAGNTVVNINAKSRGYDAIFKDNESGSGLNDVYAANGALISFNVETDPRAPNADRRIELHSGIGGEIGSTIRKEGQGLLYIAGRIDYRGLFDLKHGVTRIDGGKAVENTASLGDIMLSQFAELEIKSLGQARTTLKIGGIADINGKLTLSANAAKGETDRILVNDSGGFYIGGSEQADLNVIVYGGIGAFEDTLVKSKNLGGYFNNYEQIGRGALGTPIVAKPRPGSSADRHGIFVQDTYLIYYADEIKFGGVSHQISTDL